MLGRRLFCVTRHPPHSSTDCDPTERRIVLPEEPQEGEVYFNHLSILSWTMWLQKNKEELKKLKTWDETPIHVIPNVMVIQVLQCKLSPSSYIVGKWVVMTCVTSARYSRHTHTKSRDCESQWRVPWPDKVKVYPLEVSHDSMTCHLPLTHWHIKYGEKTDYALSHRQQKLSNILT